MVRVCVSVFACITVCAHVAGAGPMVENVPVAGGTVALAKALGLDPVPERARFLTELVRVLYDAPAGKSATSDSLRTRVSSHFDAADRARRALAAVQRSGAGFNLALARQKGERESLQRALEAIGLKLTEKNKRLSVVQTDNRDAAERRQLVTALGLDLDPIATRLNNGETVRIDVVTETVPVPLSAQLWSAAVFQRPVTAEGLFAAVMEDRAAALLSHGLAALDEETLQYLGQQPKLLRQLYEQNAAAFAAFAGSLRVRNNVVMVPGGASAASLWEDVLDAPAGAPDRLIRELFSRRAGRVAYLYDAVTHLDNGRRAFALGLWITNAERRLDRFRAFLNALEAFPGWGVPDRPFSRPSDDAIVMLTRVDADDRGVPAAPSFRTFWEKAFDGLEIPQDAARQIRNVGRDGVIDAAWVAEAVLNTATQLRAERLDQFAFGQRAFDGVPDTALPDALVAVRAFPRYRMLVLTLERLGTRTPAVYAAAVRHAEGISSLDPDRVSTALGQFQGVLALLVRLGRVHRLDVSQEEALVTSLTNVPLTKNGYAGGIARWLRGELMPMLGDNTADIDATLLQSVAAGAPGRGTLPMVASPAVGVALAAPSAAVDPVVVTWEERDYRLNLGEPERRRISRTLQRVKAETLAKALDLEKSATSLGRLEPRATDLQKARESAGSVLGVVDEMLADTLRAWAYAMELGDSNGGRVISADVTSRHDFGFTEPDNDRRLRLPWSEPEPVVQPSVPWHLAGSLLGLDLGLSQTWLRRVSADMLPQAPRLLAADRDVFVKTLAMLSAADLTERDIATVVVGINAGRQRVAQLASRTDALDEVADAIAMDGWRRSALRWTVMNEPDSAWSYFSLADMLQLGRPPAAAALNRWGVAAVALDGCLCTEFPASGRWSVSVGRSRGGQVSSQVVDLNLRVLMALAELRLPAALAKGVLAAATQDYIDNVRPLYPDDWLTMVRTAQSIPTERMADYVAALTVDGTLTPVSSPARAR